MIQPTLVGCIVYLNTYKPGLHYFVSKFEVLSSRMKIVRRRGIKVKQSQSGGWNRICFSELRGHVRKSKSKLGPDWWG